MIRAMPGLMSEGRAICEVINGFPVKIRQNRVSRESENCNAIDIGD